MLATLNYQQYKRNICLRQLSFNTVITKWWEKPSDGKVISKTTNICEFLVNFISESLLYIQLEILIIISQLNWSIWNWSKWLRFVDDAGKSLRQSLSVRHWKAKHDSDPFTDIASVNRHSRGRSLQSNNDNLISFSILPSANKRSAQISLKSGGAGVKHNRVSQDKFRLIVQTKKELHHLTVFRNHFPE